MAKNIYVGNLPYSATEDEIRNLFAEYGTVTSVNMITDQYSGRSKGFGFVEMEDDAAAAAAIQALNGKELGGRELKVDEAKPRRDRDDRGGRGGRGGGRGGYRDDRGGGRSRW